jgi:NitT/TauT family transport system substrate-binding protein
MLQRRRSFLLSSAAAAGACSRPGPATQRIRLVIAGTPANLAFLPHTIAQQLNLYHKEDLLLAADAVPGGTKGVQALLGGSADVVIGFYDHSIRMAAQGQSVQAFVSMLRCPGNVIITSPQASDRIRGLRDLKRASVGVPDLGSQAHLFLSFLLVRHGLALSDVTPVATGSQSAAVAAIERGRLDALSNFEPAVTQVLSRHPNVRILADARTQKGVREIFGVDAYPGSVLYAKTNWLEHNTDTARRLARAIKASLRWIHQHSPDEIMTLVPQAHFGEDRSIYREALVHSMDTFSENGLMPADGPEAVRKVLATFLDKVRTGHIDLSKTFTNEFVTGQ